MNTPGGTVKRILLAVTIVLAIVAAGCAEGETSAAEETTTTAVVTTTQTAPPDTSSSTTSTTTGSTEAEDDVSKLLETLSATSEITSARVEGTIEMSGLDTGTSGTTDISFSFASAFDADTGDGSFSIDMSGLADAVAADTDDPFAAMAAGMLGTMEFRQVGERAYMNAVFFNELFGAATPWISMPAEDGDDFSSGFEQVPTDPNEILEAYEGASATVEDLGAESVNGVDATHYRVTFDTSAMIDQLSAEERTELEESGIFADGLLPLDLWVSAEGYLVRLVMEIDASMSTDSEFGSMSIEYNMYDIGGPVVVSAPPADQVTAIEDLEFLDFDFDFGTDA
ncbi:MAG: hypothetical protein ACR2N2_00180 [Acidimicrobiia bacterium]